MSPRREWFRDFFDAAYVAQLREETPPTQTRREVEFVLKALALPRGARILDVPCGYGRHAAVLARRGFRVVGVDLSRAMIAEARRRFREGPRLTFVRRDVRRLAFRAEFDAVVNLYTSFGYFTAAENRATLRRLARALRPGGRLLIDHRDPAYDAALPRRLCYRAGRTRLLLEDRRFDRRTGVNETTQLVLTPGRRAVRQRRFRIQELTLGQWRRALREAGLSLERAYGGYDGRRHRPGVTGRLIVVARRPLRPRRSRASLDTGPSAA
ncbi:MAG TPA: methyltransferase domain-containing protein [Methylomirabilota bacterium]|nr:methyltransferase domain-containing protein [Methylomirabilota bacterium]